MRFFPATPYGHMKASGRWLHRVIAEAFLGECPAGQEVRHLDGDPSNNALSNLAYGTKSENGQDRVKHGRATTFAKLTIEQAREIRARAGDVANVRLAEEFGVSASLVGKILKGRVWREGE